MWCRRPACSEETAGLQTACHSDQPPPVCENLRITEKSQLRRRFQFRLRTLLIVVTLLAVPCAYVGWQAKIVREREAIANRILGLDGGDGEREGNNEPT